MKRGVVDRAVPEKCHGNRRVPRDLGRNAAPTAGGDAAADKTVSPKEPDAGIVQVHGAAASSAASVVLAVELRHQNTRVHPLGQRMAMSAVCGRDPVGRAQVRANPAAVASWPT